MYQNGESPHSSDVGDEKTEKIDPESKKKSSWPEKVTLPSIQPTVIQALPSAQQALPSLQPAEKLNLPKIQSEERKAPPRPSSTKKRTLPSIPTIEELSLPSIQVNAATSMTHMLSVLPTIEEKTKPSAPKPEQKGRPTVKSTVRRILPNIPPLEDLTLPSIEPTVVIVQPQIRSRRRRLLPNLPTIIEQTSPIPSEEDATVEGVHSLKNGASQSPDAKEKDSSSSSAPSVAKRGQTSLKSAVNETLPCGPEELRSVKPKKKASKKGSKKPRKLSKGTQTILQSTEEKVMPSLKPIKDKPPENSGATVEHPFQTSPTATENQPRQSGALSIVQAERGPEQPVKEVMPEVKSPATESSQSPQPTLEQAFPSPPITRRTNKSRPKSVPPLNLDQLCPKSPPARRVKLNPQAPEPLGNVQGAARQTQKNTKAKRLVPPLNVDHISPKPPAGRRMTTDVEPLGNVQGAARQSQAKAEAKRLVRPLNLDNISSKPPAARRMKSSPQATNVEPQGNGQRAARQNQTKAEAKRLVPPLNLDNISAKPPAARRMKSSPPATNVEPQGNVQRAARQSQTKAEAKQLVQPLNLEHISSKSPAARRMKLSSQTTDVEPQGNVQRAARQTQTKAEELFSQQQTLEHKIPKPPAARRMKLSSQTTRETLGSAQGTKSRTKVESLLGPQHTLEHNFSRLPATKPSKVSPQATEGEPLKSVPGTLPETLTKSETVLNPQHTLDHNPPRPAAARPTKADLTVTDSEEVPSVPSRKKKTPTSEHPKPGTYAFMNLKRREFEALQRLERMAKQCRANGQPVGKGRHPRDLLTVKSALPGIQSTKEDAILLKPHPPAANFTKKGLPSVRPPVKRPRPKIRAPLEGQLTNLQPNVKQVLPSISSSSLHTLIKQPLPSVQPDDTSSFQPMVEETEQSSQSGHLSGLERQ